ncbi:MAG TPA: ABC transporter ATP-binding protein [Acidimicrobiia bacterium]
MSTVVSLRGASAGYDGTAVVRHVDLHVDEGEVVALLGPNGAGKTTTLLTISGMLRPLGGEVTVLGRPVAGTPPFRIARRGVAHVPEDRSLFSDLTARENLLLGRRRKRARSIDAVLHHFPQLERVLASRAGLLSGGEQQMLAVGRALVSNPKVLIVDEMSLGLAPIVVERLMPVLREIAADRGTGVLFVEQHVHLALQVADRGYVMSHGEIVLEGPARDLAARADLMAASYLGDALMPAAGPFDIGTGSNGSRPHASSGERTGEGRIA